MKVLLIGGTSEGVTFAEKLSEADLPFLASVVTAEAAAGYQNKGYPVRTGPLDFHGFVDLLGTEKISLICDLSHPFADKVSVGLIAAASESGVGYIRFQRPGVFTLNDLPQGDAIKKVVREIDAEVAFTSSFVEAARYAGVLARKKVEEKGRATLFLATGSKNLKEITGVIDTFPGVELVVRFLPRKENIELAMELGIDPKNIVAVQGPFSEELNLALYRKFNTDVLVTKASGGPGSYAEKLDAAAKAAIPVVVVCAPVVDYPEVTDHLEKLMERVKGYLSNTGSAAMN